MPSSSVCEVDEVDHAEAGFRHRGASLPENDHCRARPHINLDANFEARIENPLAGVPRRRLLLAVDEFCREKQLEEHSDVIRKGALIARDPTGYEDITGTEALDQPEIDALRDEVLHRWRISGALLLTVVTCSIGAIVQGWDQTGSNGATVDFPDAYGIGGDDDVSKLMVGLVNAAPYLGTSLVGCWLSDPLNDLVGRRGTIFFSANLCLWPVVASAFCNTWQQLLICRLLLGLGMGTKASTSKLRRQHIPSGRGRSLTLDSVPIFAAENSPAPIRGAIVMCWQLWTAFGIFLGTCANLAVFKVSQEPWRYQLGSAIIPAIPLAVMIYFCPESPRWYMKKNRYHEAMMSLLRLRNNPVQAGRDLYYIHVQLELEQQFLKRGNYVKKFAELFYVPRLRRATLSAFTAMIAQQMCGINIIAFYSTTIFRDSGASDFQALSGSLGFGIVNFIFAFPAIWAIDTFGRRSLLLFTFPMMAWTIAAAGLCTLIPGTGGAHLGMVALFVYLFAAFYSPGEGPVPFTYAAEVFPLSHREIGMAFSVATCLFWAAVVSITFPLMLRDFGVIGSFLFYMGLNIVALIMIFLFLPETKQRTLEELDYIFAVPTRVFIRYQVTKALPWWFRRWVLFQKNAALEPLYRLDGPVMMEHEINEPNIHDNEKARVEMKDLLGCYNIANSH